MSRPETPDTAPLPIVPPAEDETARDAEARERAQREQRLGGLIRAREGWVVRSSGATKRLAELGAGPETIVAVALDRSLELALALVAVLSPAELSRAVHTEDLAALTSVPGIGKKGAQRLVLTATMSPGPASSAGPRSRPSVTSSSESRTFDTVPSRFIHATVWPLRSVPFLMRTSARRPRQAVR